MPLVPRQQQGTTARSSSDVNAAAARTSLKRTSGTRTVSPTSRTMSRASSLSSAAATALRAAASAAKRSSSTLKRAGATSTARATTTPSIGQRGAREVVRTVVGRTKPPSTTRTATLQQATGAAAIRNTAAAAAAGARGALPGTTGGRAASTADSLFGKSTGAASAAGRSTFDKAAENGAAATGARASSASFGTSKDDLFVADKTGLIDTSLPADGVLLVDDGTAQTYDSWAAGEPSASSPMYDQWAYGSGGGGGGGAYPTYVPPEEQLDLPAITAEEPVEFQEEESTFKKIVKSPWTWAAVAAAVVGYLALSGDEEE